MGGTKQIHAADNQPTYPDKSKRNAETRYGMKQEHSGHGDKSGTEQSNECGAGKGSQRDVNRVQSPEQQRRLFFDTLNLCGKEIRQFASF